MDLKNCTIVPKKSPNNPNIPKLSNMNPTKDHLIKISIIPNAKQTVPLILVGRVKKETVRCGPIIRMRPIIKSKLPKARSPESKNVNIPNMKKKIPPAVKPTPNFRKKK